MIAKSLRPATIRRRSRGEDMRFRPCIDLHEGRVKQIVGSTLDDTRPGALATNFTADKPSSWYAALYREDGLTGGHVIKLGPGNDEAALAALAAWPGGLQVGGGITADNAARWLDAGASHVIVTSHVFSNGRVDHRRLQELVKAVGRHRLVLDLSCRRRGDEYFIVTDRWQKFTSVTISAEVLEELARSCEEYLIHAADVEGKCNGIEADLVRRLAEWSPLPTTYAGGVRDIDDLRLIRDLGKGRLDVTVGSALDIFGGTTMTYRGAIRFASSSGS